MEAQDAAADFMVESLPITPAMTKCLKRSGIMMVVGRWLIVGTCVGVPLVMAVFAIPIMTGGFGPPNVGGGILVLVIAAILASVM